MIRADETAADAAANALNGIVDVGLDPETIARLQDRIHNSKRKRKGGRRKASSPRKGSIPSTELHLRTTLSSQQKVGEQQVLRSSLRKRNSLDITSFEAGLIRTANKNKVRTRDVRDEYPAGDDDDDERIDDDPTSPRNDEFGATGRSRSPTRRAGAFLAYTHSGKQKVRPRSPSPLGRPHRPCMTTSPHFGIENY